MKMFYSLRFRLLILYFLTIVIPTAIMMYTMPSYYYHVISDETTKLTQGTMEALLRNMNTYLDDLEQVTTIPYVRKEFMDELVFHNSDQYKMASDYEKFTAESAILDSLIYTLQSTRRDISGAMMVTNDGTPIITSKRLGSRPDTTSGYVFTEQDWYRKAVAADGKAVFINVHSQDYLLKSPSTRVFSVARLIKEPISQKSMGVLMADADTSVLEGIFKGVGFNVTSIISILDSNNSLIYTNGILTADETGQISRGELLVKGAGDTYVSVVKPIARAGWKMAVLLSDSEIKAKFRWIYVIGILFTAGELLLAFSLFFILSRLITNPFNNMSRLMKEVENGNLQVRFNVRKKDEISQLGNSFNRMIARLNDLIDSEYRAVLSKRNAEYYALQSQIHPHFLYNTLNGFIGLNRLGERDKLEKAIFALTGILRYTLEQGDWTTVAEEFLFLSRYCELQKTRFQDRLEVSIHYDETVAAYKIPKLLIQPLVENAIIHGIEPSDGKGTVRISAETIENAGSVFLRIVIEDNGVGFDTEALSEKKSVGLSNVRERLNMIYNGAELKISSRINKGTCIVIDIPEGDVKV